VNWSAVPRYARDGFLATLDCGHIAYVTYESPPGWWGPVPCHVCRRCQNAVAACFPSWWME